MSLIKKFRIWLGYKLLGEYQCEPEIHNKYYELIMNVERKFKGESRHDTALRYIREAENVKCEPAQENPNMIKQIKNEIDKWGYTQ